MVKTAPATSAASVKSAAAKQPTKAQADAIRSACRSDYQSYCPGIKRGSTAAWSCLQAKVVSLSGPCQQAVYAVTGGNPAETAVATPKISAPPAATPVQLPITRVVTPRQVLSLMRTACGSDFRTFCPGVALGGGRALSCLEDKAASLSPHCKGIGRIEPLSEIGAASRRGPCHRGSFALASEPRAKAGLAVSTRLDANGGCARDEPNRDRGRRVRADRLSACAHHRFRARP